MLTMDEVMALEVMAEGKVHTGKELLHKRTVKGVSVIEIPVEDFVRENEFVLSTGIGCGHDTTLLAQFVNDIATAKPSALALAIGPYISSIPEEVIRQAQAQALPLIEVPWGLRFADVTQTVVETINERRQKESEHSERIQQQLLNLILHGGNLSGVAQFIYEKTRLPAAILERSGAIKGTSHGSEKLIEQIQGAKQPPFIKIPIQSAGTIQGHVVLASTTGPTRETEILLSHAATAAGLWFLRENAVAETESRLLGDFIWHLAQGQLDEPWDVLRSRARSLQIDIDASYVCLIGQIESRSQGVTDDPSGALNHKIHALIQSLEKDTPKKTMSTYRGDLFIIYLQTTPTKATDDVHVFLEKLEQRLSLPEDVVLSWGIGESQTGVGTFQQSFQAAKSALEIGRRQNGPGYLTTYAHTRMYRALTQLAENEELQNITHHVLEKLLSYQQDKNIDLVETFIAYLHHKENISQTARSLHLHRQSLLYRLRKIESLTGYNLNHPDDVFMLHLCIKLRLTQTD